MTLLLLNTRTHTHLPSHQHIPGEMVPHEQLVIKKPKKVFVVKGSTANKQTVGLLGPLLSDDRLNSVTVHSPLTLSCRARTAQCQRLGSPPSKQLPT